MKTSGNPIMPTDIPLHTLGKPRHRDPGYHAAKQRESSGGLMGDFGLFFRVVITLSILVLVGVGSDWIVVFFLLPSDPRVILGGLIMAGLYVFGTTTLFVIWRNYEI